MKFTEQSETHLYEVWRLDENGNKFLVETFGDRDLAEAKIALLGEGCHKQVYWVEEVVKSRVF